MFQNWYWIQSPSISAATFASLSFFDPRRWWPTTPVVAHPGGLFQAQVDKEKVDNSNTKKYKWGKHTTLHKQHYLKRMKQYPEQKWNKSIVTEKQQRSLRSLRVTTSSRSWRWASSWNWLVTVPVIVWWFFVMVFSTHWHFLMVLLCCFVSFLMFPKLFYLWHVHISPSLCNSKETSCFVIACKKTLYVKVASTFEPFKMLNLQRYGMCGIEHDSGSWRNYC